MSVLGVNNGDILVLFVVFLVTVAMPREQMVCFGGAAPKRCLSAIHGHRQLCSMIVHVNLQCGDEMFSERASLP